MNDPSCTQASITPCAQIKANGKDLSDLLDARLMALVVTDRSSMKSDTMEMTLADPEPRIEMPKLGALLEVALGYQETGTRKLGTFVVDEVELSGPPSQVLIRGKALDTTGKIKEKRSRSWAGAPEETVALQQVIEDIARDHNLTPAISEDYRSLQLPSVIQNNESDLHLVTRLAKQYGAVTKIAAGHLLFTKPGTGKTVASGKRLPTRQLRPHQIYTWHLTRTERGAFQSVAAKYHDLTTATTETVTVGEGAPVMTLMPTYASADEALQSAKGKLHALSRDNLHLQLTLPGHNSILAEQPLELSIRSTVNGTWIVEEVTHHLEPGSYSLDVTATPAV